MIFSFFFQAQSSLVDVSVTANKCDSISTMDDTFALTGFCGNSKSQDSKKCAQWATEAHELYKEYYKFRESGAPGAQLRSPKLVKFYGEAIATLDELLALNKASIAAGGSCVTLVAKQFLTCEIYMQSLTQLKAQMEKDLSSSPSLGNLHRLVNIYSELKGYGLQKRFSPAYENLLNGDNAERPLGLIAQREYSGWPHLEVPTSHRGGTLAKSEFNAISHIPFSPIGLTIKPKKIDLNPAIKDHIDYALHDNNHGIFPDRNQNGATPLDSFRCGCQINDILLNSPPSELKDVNETWFNGVHESRMLFNSKQGLQALLSGGSSGTFVRLRERVDKLTDKCFSDKEREEEFEKAKAMAAAAAKIAAQKELNSKRTCTTHNPQGLKDLDALPGLAMRKYVAERFAKLSPEQQSQVIAASVDSLLASRAPHLEFLQSRLRNIPAPVSTAEAAASILGKIRTAAATGGASIAASVFWASATRAATEQREEPEYYFNKTGISALGNTDAGRFILEKHPVMSNWIVELNNQMDAIPR